MSSLNVALYTSQSSLLTTQKKMSITSNNLANMDKTGYHRQVANSQINNPIDTPSGQFGTGSHITGIVRVFDQALENGFRQAMSEEGSSNVYSDQLYRLEGTLSPSGSESALTDSVHAFADSLQSVANRPEATDSRLDMLAKADGMAIQFNETYMDIASLRDGIATAAGAGTLADNVSKLNRLATELNEVNSQITEAEARLFNPTQANDLRDRRDQLAVEMSKLTDITITEEANKSYTVTVGGVKLVDGALGTVDTLALDMTGGTPAFTWASGPAATITEGKLAGLTNAWNYLDGKAADLWTYATDLTNAVNSQLLAGFREDGTAGVALFGNVTPGGMTVLTSTPTDIAASDSATESGSGKTMISLYNTLKDTGLISRSEEYINSVASDAANASAAAYTATSGREMFANSIAAMSSVSIDEEMIDMLNLQRAFQASSRVVSAVDEMLQQAIAMV